jgi:hypothetical protein
MSHIEIEAIARVIANKYIDGFKNQLIDALKVETKYTDWDNPTEVAAYSALKTLADVLERMP